MNCVLLGAFLLAMSQWAQAQSKPVFGPVRVVAKTENSNYLLPNDAVQRDRVGPGFIVRKEEIVCLSRSGESAGRVPLKDADSYMGDAPAIFNKAGTHFALVTRNPENHDFFSPEGRILSVYDLKCKIIWQHTNVPERYFHLSPAGNYVFAHGSYTGNSNPPAVYSRSRRITVQSDKTKEPWRQWGIADIEGSPSRTSFVVAIPNMQGKSMIVAFSSSGKELWRTPAHFVKKVRFSPDGRFVLVQGEVARDSGFGVIAMSASDGRILWSVPLSQIAGFWKTQAILRRYPGPVNESEIIGVDLKKGVRIWTWQADSMITDARTDQQTGRLLVATSSVRKNESGFLDVVSEQVFLIDASGKELDRLEIPSEALQMFNQARGIEISKDGQYAALITEKSIRIHALQH